MNNTNKLMPYITHANMIAESFGPTCEVVIHDLSTPENSVYYVANGHVTNRKVGQSFDHLIKQVLLSKRFSNNYTANYFFTTDSGKRIKSSTSFILDENEDIIGAFCINIDLSLFNDFKNYLDCFVASDNTTYTDSVHTDQELGHVGDIIDDLINKIIGSKDITKFKRKDNVQLISFMYDKGIFLAKGSVEKVAERLNISPVTVYSYLDEIKKNGLK